MTEPAALDDPELENIDLSISDALENPAAQPDAAQAAVDCVLRLRRLRWRTGRWREFEPLVRQAAEACDALGETESWAVLTAYHAGLNEANGRWKRAVELAELALGRAADPRTRAEALLHSASANHNLGCNHRARSQLVRALAEARGDLAQTMRLKHKLHRVEEALGHDREAGALLEEVLAWAQGENDRSFESELLLDRAARVKRCDPAAALRLVAKARFFYHRLGLPRGTAYADLEAGLIYVKVGKTERARHYLTRARISFVDRGYAPGLSHALFGLGTVAMTERRFSEAFQFFDMSGDIARQRGYRTAVARAVAYSLLAAARSRGLGQMLSALAKVRYLDARTFGLLRHFLCKHRCTPSTDV